MSNFLSDTRNNKFVMKYMNMAKYIASQNDICYSRQIGVVITDKHLNKILSTGYNGPPRGIPHCNTPEHYRNVFVPQLNSDERLCLQKKMNLETFSVDKFVEKFAYKKECPRKLIGCKSGDRLTLCTCVHAEVNAIINAECNLRDSFMFAYCPLPCIECTKVIINVGVSKLFCYKENVDYSIGSRYLFQKSNIEVFEIDRNEFNNTQI